MGRTIPEYVYALHDFLPGNEDELSFHAGERIAVVEKDDLYGDGWWQGRNLAGKVGLFPKIYTGPAPPHYLSSSSITGAKQQTSSAMQVAKEEPQPIAYVYALYDFLREHEDEVSFRAGERIEVVEKDDLYGDGWWQGRDVAGKVGLFPKIYTGPAPPDSLSIISSSSSITLANQESDSATPADKEEHRRKGSNGDEVMKATMADVQKAIEQLGTSRGRVERAGGCAPWLGWARWRGRDRERDVDRADRRVPPLRRGESNVTNTTTIGHPERLESQVYAHRAHRVHRLTHTENQ
ncbi:hypothetical protein H0H81_012283 [Sphagnurus paluster]|uniref:SH3 domain-containing protein n=1 Tax=Sphagnurus paluster TaxID=117069 RepID=A0A9P7GGX4_9AGAR|nr:hypothetical protein H0H81_012283 [Sphagnurus paluster]